MQRRERPLGMTERGTEPRDVVEPELDPKRLERKKPVEQGQLGESVSMAPATLGYA